MRCVSDMSASSTSLISTHRLEHTHFSSQINTHWFENFCGMWWHLVSIIIIDRLGFQQHALSGVAFLVIGSMLSSLNHLSFDTRLPFGMYSATEHLTHHRFSKLNYGAYIQVWVCTRYC